MGASADGRRAVVLLSGGLDSATVLAIARADGFLAFALTLDYGQRHALEVDAARRVAAAAGVARHMVLPLDLRAFGGSALTADEPLPRDRTPQQMNEGIPATYVPARNTIFLALALGWAEALGARDLFIGVNALDYAGYPDCRPEFLTAFERLAELATKAGVEGQHFRIHAPLVQLSKTEIIRRGVALGVEFALTTSCYDPAEDGQACGRCDACVLRLQGFAENGMRDPRPYRG
jgi:7-cyano-7-deazaguanine synthase